MQCIAVHHNVSFGGYTIYAARQYVLVAVCFQVPAHAVRLLTYCHGVCAVRLVCYTYCYFWNDSI